MTKTYLLGNVGRTKRGNSTRLDTDALEALFDAATKTDLWVAFLNEIREGDDNNELALAKRLAPKGARFYCTNTREPIVLAPAFAPARDRVLWVRDSSVPHWSPQRSINLVHLPDEDETLIGGHYAAGAYHGDRPEWARGELRTSWGNMFEVHQRVERRLNNLGRDVTWGMDVNHLHMPRVTSRERTAVHDRTDWIRYSPAPGRVGRFDALPEIPFHIDSHDGQRARGSYRDAA